MRDPAAHLADPSVDQRPAAFSGPRSRPESPENPEDRGQQPKIHDDQPTAVIHPMARSPTPRPPHLNVSATDIIQLSRFLVYPFEHYTRLDDLHTEIGGMTTRTYVSLKAGLTLAAREQIQRIRRLAYNHKYEKNLKQLHEEQERLTQQLDLARHTALTLQREMGWIQDAYNRAQQTMAHLQQTNTILHRFCQTRLQQSTAVYALEAQLRRGVGGNPPQAPHDSQGGGGGQ